MGITIKDAPLVEQISGYEKIPISDGSNEPKTVNIEQIKEFANKDIEIPKKVSELENDSGYATSKEVEDAISKIPTPDVGGQISAALVDYVKKVEGKGLSTNDFTNELKAKLETIIPNDISELEAEIGKLETSLNTLVGGNASNAIESFNEIIAFLENVSDKETLGGIIAGINARIAEVEGKIPTKVSELDNDKGYLNEHQDISHLATKDELKSKQDVISDLANIREGAAKGATAIQEEQYKGTIAAVDTNDSVDDAELVYATKGEVVIANQKADDALKTATTAKNAVSTLEGLVDATTSMETLAGQVVQIEDNKQKLSELSQAVDVKMEEDSAYFADREGHVIFKVDKFGAKSTDLFYKDENGDFKSVGENFSAMLICREDDSYYFTDKYGNIICRIDKNGVSATEFKAKNTNGVYTNFLYKKNLITMGDSLFANGVFGNHLARLSGALFDEKLNNGRYSVGGTRTVSYSDDCGQGRMQKLVEDGVVVPDVIIYANTNDGNALHQVGSSEDESWFRTKVEKLSMTPLADSSEATSYFDSNFNSVVKSVVPSVGTMIGIPYKVNTGIKLNILSAPTRNGNISIKLSNSDRKSIYVLADDSVSDIINKILEYDYNGWIDEKSGESSVLFSTSLSSPSLTIDVGNTGINYEIEQNVSANIYEWRYFIGHDLSKWEDKECWNNHVSLWAGWKGLVEYAQKHFPNAMIYFAFLKTYGVDFTSAEYKRPDGSLNWDKILTKNTVRKTLYGHQRDFCNYYEIPYIDLCNESCLTVGNIDTYMNVNNVHPKDDAYKRWAETVNRMLN